MGLAFRCLDLISPGCHHQCPVAHIRQTPNDCVRETPSAGWRLQPQWHMTSRGHFPLRVADPQAIVLTETNSGVVNVFEQNNDLSSSDEGYNWVAAPPRHPNVVSKHCTSTIVLAKSKEHPSPWLNPRLMNSPHYLAGPALHASAQTAGTGVASSPTEAS